MITRFILFLVFILIAAPFEVIVNLWTGYFGSDQKIFLKPLADAAVYLYAFTLCAETLFRIEQHSLAFQRAPWLLLIKWACYVLILIFVIDYLALLRPKILTGGSAFDAWVRQIILAVFAIIASLLSFLICERQTTYQSRSQLATSSPP